MSKDYYRRCKMCKEYAAQGLNIRAISNRIQTDTGTHMSEESITRIIEGKLPSYRISLPMGQVYDTKEGELSEK